MDADNPLPRALVLLAAALPFIAVAAHHLARRASSDRGVANVVAPGLAISLWVVSIHVAAYVARSFVPGLVIGTVAPAMAGAVAFARGGSRGGGPPRRAPWMLVWAALTTALVAVPLATAGAWHDETSPVGHMSIVAQMQNGHYPPRFIPFADNELRYHYGFDILSAAVSAILRTKLTLTFDIVTCALWFYGWCVLWKLGEKLTDGLPEMPGRNVRGFLTALLVLLGGGVGPILGWKWRYPPALCFISSVHVDGHMLNPPTISYFFQHPFSIGIPLCGCFLLLALDEARTPRLVHAAAMATLMLTLAISQFVLFVCLSPAWVFATALGERRAWRRTALGFAAALAALAIATRVGGFFAPHYPAAGRDLLFWSRDAPVRWQLAFTGLLVPLGLAGFLVVRRLRLLLATLFAGSVVVLNTCRYAHTWDIAKFGTVASIVLALLSAVFLARLGAVGRARKVIATILALATCVAGFTFVRAVATHYAPGFLGAAFYVMPSPVSADDAAALRFLRRHVGEREIVYRAERSSWPYNYWAGLATTWPSYQIFGYGFPPSEMKHFSTLFPSAPPEPDEYRRLGVVWFVLSPADKRLRAVTDAWIKDGIAERAGAFGALTVVHLKREGGPDAPR